METTAIQPAQRKITLEEKLKISYCVENWVKIEQVKANIAAVKGRIQAASELRSDPIALVNFGPSLNDTWEKIREFKFVMTCSGAHKFCVERGIIPTWDVNVDPRPHKVGLMGPPQKETEYLVASTCSPKLVEHLAGFKISLWHIFDNEEEGFRIIPHGDWQVTGGCSVGVRTMTLARFLGFTDLHIFGMDGNFGASGTHAAEHPNSPKNPYALEYDGKEYQTTPSMLEAVKNTWHELDMLKDVKATFYGEGLTQAMAKNYKRKEIKEGAQVFIAFNKPELISAEYRDLNRRLHNDNLAYGVGAGRHAETVTKLVKILAKKTEFVRVLDYGCGKGYLAKALPFPIDEYDPAVPGKEDSPRPADLVCCLDVLEHIEPDRLDFVLDDLRRCTKQLAFLVIHTGASKKFLSDGRNSHLIMEGEAFWRERLGKFFDVPEKGFNHKGPLLYVTAGKKSATRTQT